MSVQVLQNSTPDKTHDMFPSMYPGMFPEELSTALGNKVDANGKTVLDKFKVDAEARKTVLQGEIDKVNEKIKKKGKTTKNLQRQLDDLNSQVAEVNSAVAEADAIEKSTQLYTLKYKGASGTGATYYDVVTSAVIIEYTTTASLAHELKHAYQFEVNEISFDPATGKPGKLYDLTDETAAYRRDYAFGDRINFSSYSGITDSAVAGLTEPGYVDVGGETQLQNVPVYDKLPKEKISGNTTLSEARKIRKESVFTNDDAEAEKKMLSMTLLDIIKLGNKAQKGMFEIIKE